MSKADLRSRIEAIEKSYELQLAYAAQGVKSDADSKRGGELRDLMQAAARAMAGLGPVLWQLAEEQALAPEEARSDLLSVVERDANAAGAAYRLVLARSAISSQLVDNLNASIHVRALLTDLFLLDELLEIGAAEEGSS